MTGVGNVPVNIGHSARNSFETFSRIGFIAKGIVYLLIGLLALLAALGGGGDTTGKKEAVTKLLHQPFGEVILLFLGVGLLAYALWRFVTSFADTENEGSSPKGIFRRVFYFFSGITYGSTGLYALKLGLGNRSGSKGMDAQTWTARLLDAPLGTILIILIGGVMLLRGIEQIFVGWSEEFRYELKSLPPGHQWVIRLGKWGYMARGVVFCLIGVLIMTAAVRHDPSEVRGIEGALDALASQPYGPVLLALVAGGLVCFGIFSLIESRYRRI